MPRMNKKNGIFTVKYKGAPKLKGREIWGCAKISGAKFKGARILMGIR